MMHHIPERRRPWRSVLVLAVVVLAGSLIWLVKPGRAAASLSAQVPGAQSVLSATAPVPTRQDSAAPPAATPPTLPVVLANPQVACATTVIANAAPVPSGAQAVVVGIEQAKAEIAALEAARDTPRLRRALGRAVVRDDLDAAWRRSLWPRLEQLNAAIVFAVEPADGFSVELVRKGDTLWSLCQRLKRNAKIDVAPGLISSINHVPASGLKAGTRLKVPSAEVSVVVDKSDFRLYLLLDGVVIHHVSAGIGREGLTPEDTFSISSRIVRPDWTDPATGKTIRYGELGHKIGGRWLGFSRSGKKTGWGIHGTVEPLSVGQAMSDGCIRLAEDDLVRIFEWIPEGTEVLIRP